MMFSNSTYDRLKWVAQVLLPALGTLYFAIAAIWHLPNANEVVGTVVAADTFLGGILSISTRSYENSGAKYDGVMNVIQKDENTKTMSLELNAHPDDLENQKQVTFKVNTP